MTAGISDLVSRSGVIICVGPGGVGKTTISAAIAIAGAAMGRRSIVCTIDPARRLASSMGINELGNEEREIPAEALAGMGVGLRAPLFGMMLDTKRTFDDLIMRLAPNEKAAEAIRNNAYYQNLSDSFAGSQEYTAIEKLYSLHGRGDYDLIVLDTPPTKHALDFLDAPRRMIDFLDGRVIQWFIKPYAMAGRIGFRFAQRSARMVFSMMEKVTGFDVMADLTEFFMAFEGLWEGFRERSAKVEELLRGAGTSFVMVTSPATLALAESSYFARKLIELDMSLGGVVFNRMHRDLLSEHGLAGPFELRRAIRGPSKLAKWMASAGDDGALVEAVGGRLADLSELGRMDSAAVADFMSDLPASVPTAEVREFDRDVHDLASLAAVAKIILDSSGIG